MAESVLVERIPVERNTAFSLGNTTWGMCAQYRDGTAVDSEQGSVTLNVDGTGHLMSNVQDYDLTWSLEGNEIVLNVQGQTIQLQLCLVWNEENTTQVFSPAE